VRVDDGPFKGEVYFGSNHGLTRVRGDLYGDHRHPTFDYPSCAATAGTAFECDELPEAIGKRQLYIATDAGLAVLTE